MNFPKHGCIAAFAFMLALPAHAGAWGEGAFDNDAAQDFLAECARSNDDTVVSQAIEMALVASFLDADDGAAAVAAAEVVAGALGSRDAVAPRSVVPCLAGTPPHRLRALASRAARAMTRVADAGGSELAQQWAEEGPNRWAAGLQRLAERLRR